MGRERNNSARSRWQLVHHGEQFLTPYFVLREPRSAMTKEQARHATEAANEERATSTAALAMSISRRVIIFCLPAGDNLNTKIRDPCSDRTVALPSIVPSLA
ncbi:MAG: hypothetical protein ACI915_002812 [Gammaproteobacteria bacterium]|jgi:hypothetical protein